MSDTTPRLALPVLPPTPLQPHVTHNEALAQLDALTDLCLKGQFVNTPPSSPADGDSYLLGGTPTGAWSGHAYKIAYCLDGAWRFFLPFDGLRGFVSGSNAFLVYLGGQWLDASALTNANEVAIASAATCDLGAAGSLFVAVTGTTAITSFGSGANLLRFVRFAGALTLTHDAITLILPGAANIATAAGDSAIFASDGGGNWRCRDYARADGQPIATALDVTSLKADVVAGGGAAIGGWSGNAQAEFQTDARTYALSAYAASGNGALLVNVDSTSARLADFWFNRAASVGSVTTNGSSVAYNTTSDARLKTVGEQRDWRATIRALWVGDFTWKESGAPGFGVLAQQAYDVMPYHAGVTRPAEDDGAWQASSEPFAFLSLWGVKDLYALVEALAARVAALEAHHAAG